MVEYETDLNSIVRVRIVVEDMFVLIVRLDLEVERGRDGRIVQSGRNFAPAREIASRRTQTNAPATRLHTRS